MLLKSPFNLGSISATAALQSAMGSQLSNHSVLPWVPATWEDYLAQRVAQRRLDQTKSYYYKGQMRLEAVDGGADHGSDWVLTTTTLSLYAATRAITLSGRTSCLYRKAGIRDCQPDLSYYIGLNAAVLPNQTEMVDLDQYPPPDLVIEVSLNSLADDQGTKRLLYEDLNVREYWIVDVYNAAVLGFAIANQGSQRITESQVLPKFPLTLLERVLRLSRRRVQSEVIAWMLKQMG